MPTAPYNQRPASLQDLFAQQMNAPAYPVDVPSPPVAPGAVGDQGDVLTPQQRSSLLEQLLTPRPETAQAPDEQATFGKKFANTIADTFNNIATIYAGGPNLRSNYLEDYLNSIERRNAEKKRKSETKADRDAAMADRKAQYLLSADDRARMKQDELAGRKELKQMQIDQQKAQQQQQLDEFTRTKEFQADMAKKQQDFETIQQQARLTHEEKIAGISRRIADGDKEALRQQEGLGSAMAYIGASVDSIPQLLKGDQAAGIPPMTPEQIVTKYRRALDAMLKIGLTGDARKAAEAYFVQEAGPILKQYETEQMNQDLASGAPQRPSFLDALPQVGVIPAARGR